MSRFLDPPKEGKRLSEDKVDKTYKAMRTKVFLGAFFGYAAYYLNSAARWPAETTQPTDNQHKCEYDGGVDSRVRPKRNHACENHSEGR